MEMEIADNNFRENLIQCLPKLRAYAIMLTRNRNQADDLLQDVAVKALKSWTQFRPGTNFKAWLYCIMRNHFISSMRRNKKVECTLDTISETFLKQPAAQEDRVMLQQVNIAMNNLDAGRREALILVCAMGLSYEEAAIVLGCPTGTVKSRIWRARQDMEALLMPAETESTAPKARASTEPATRYLD